MFHVCTIWHLVYKILHPLFDQENKNLCNHYKKNKSTNAHPMVSCYIKNWTEGKYSFWDLKLQIIVLKAIVHPVAQGLISTH
uniref:Uncharacterized protein n=1 Tax=Arundo donax TaxID=35708 RepID=A0A0A9CYZ9_ARUDO